MYSLRMNNSQLILRMKSLIREWMKKEGLSKFFIIKCRLEYDFVIYILFKERFLCSLLNGYYLSGKLSLPIYKESEEPRVKKAMYVLIEHSIKVISMISEKKNSSNVDILKLLTLLEIVKNAKELEF